jgi:hypothetical protein
MKKGTLYLMLLLFLSCQTHYKIVTTKKGAEKEILKQKRKK